MQDITHIESDDESDDYDTQVDTNSYLFIDANYVLQTQPSTKKEQRHYLFDNLQDLVDNYKGFMHDSTLILNRQKIRNFLRPFLWAVRQEKGLPVFSIYGNAGFYGHAENVGMEPVREIEIREGSDQSMAFLVDILDSSREKPISGLLEYRHLPEQQRDYDSQKELERILSSPPGSKFDIKFFGFVGVPFLHIQEVDLDEGGYMQLQIRPVTPETLILQSG